MKPTVGRIVHFYDPTLAASCVNRGIGAGPYAAIIVRVIPANDPVIGDGPDNAAVDLTVFAPGGEWFGLDDIPCFDAIDRRPRATQEEADQIAHIAYWTWPPRDEPCAYVMAAPLPDGAPLFQREQPVDDTGERIDPSLQA